MAEENAEQALEDQLADFLHPENKAEDPPEDEPEAEVEDVGDDEPEDVEEAADEESPEDLVEVEYEGEIIEAPRKIADALLRQADYTRKTQEVAEQRKAVEVRLGEVEAAQRQYEFFQETRDDVLKVQQLAAQADQGEKWLRDNINDLSTTEIEQAKFAIQDMRKESEQLSNMLHSKSKEFQQAQQQALQELLDKGTEVLRSRIPGWDESHSKQLRDYALNTGFSEQEIDHVVDPRQVEVLWKASQYDALQAGKVAAIKKVQAAPKIKQKARNPMPKDVQNKLNLRKKLKSEKLTESDKARLIGEDIAGRFFG